MGGQGKNGGVLKGSGSAGDLNAAARRKVGQQVLFYSEFFLGGVL
jgi:hypothetical protein